MEQKDFNTIYLSVFNHLPDYLPKINDDVTAIEEFEECEVSKDECEEEHVCDLTPAA